MLQHHCFQAREQVEGVARATRLARHTAPRCWVPHNPDTLTTRTVLLPGGDHPARPCRREPDLLRDDVESAAQAPVGAPCFVTAATRLFPATLLSHVVDVRLINPQGKMRRKVLRSLRPCSRATGQNAARQPLPLRRAEHPEATAFRFAAGGPHSRARGIEGSQQA